MCVCVWVFQLRPSHPWAASQDWYRFDWFWKTVSKSISTGLISIFYFLLLLCLVEEGWGCFHYTPETPLKSILFCLFAFIVWFFCSSYWKFDRYFIGLKRKTISHIYLCIYIYIYIYSGFMYFSKLFHIEKWMGFFCSKCDWWLKSRNDVKRKCLHFLNSDLVGEMSFPHRMFSRGFSRLPWNIQMQSGTTKTETDWEIDYTRGPQQSATYIFSCYYMFKPHFLVLLLLNIVLYINFFVLDILYSSYLHVCCTYKSWMC